MSPLGGAVSGASLLMQARQKSTSDERAARERADEFFARQLQAQLDAEDLGATVHTAWPVPGMPAVSHHTSPLSGNSCAVYQPVAQEGQAVDVGMHSAPATHHPGNRLQQALTAHAIDLSSPYNSQAGAMDLATPPRSQTELAPAAGVLHHDLQPCRSVGRSSQPTENVSNPRKQACTAFGDLFTSEQLASTGCIHSLCPKAASVPSGTNSFTSPAVACAVDQNQHPNIAPPGNAGCSPYLLAVDQLGLSSTMQGVCLCIPDATLPAYIGQPLVWDDQQIYAYSD